MVALLYLTECVVGFFGDNCVENCSKMCGDPGVCDKVTGHCNGSCLAGWEGVMCQNGKCVRKLYMYPNSNALSVIFTFDFLVSSYSELFSLRYV